MIGTSIKSLWIFRKRLTEYGKKLLLSTMNDRLIRFIENL